MKHRKMTSLFGLAIYLKELVISPS